MRKHSVEDLAISILTFGFCAAPIVVIAVVLLLGAL
jgi:hypothetical protein